MRAAELEYDTESTMKTTASVRATNVGTEGTWIAFLASVGETEFRHKPPVV